MIDIIKYKHIPFIFSAVLFLTSVVLLITIGLKPGIDFTGGTLMELDFSESRPDLAQMQEVLDAQELGTVLVQPVDSTGYIIKMAYLNEDQHQQVLNAIRTNFQQGEERILEKRLETVGPSISNELTERATKTGVVVVLAIVIYVAYAFRKVTQPISSWKFGVTAIIALLHDVLITMGVFVLLGKYAGVEVDIPFIVALLTILGYSVNDTIVVFDRIREKLLLRGGQGFADTINKSIHETIPRSINTSGTTVLVLLALFLFGGESIRYFALALIIGIGFGTYSSIFLASPLLLVWHTLDEKFRKTKKA